MLPLICQDTVGRCARRADMTHLLWFPTKVDCVEGGHRMFLARVTALVVASSDINMSSVVSWRDK